MIINLKRFKIEGMKVKQPFSGRDFVTKYLFIYLLIYTLRYVDIYNKKHKNIVIYTTHYIPIAIQMVFNKQICMLIYVNQSNGEKRESVLDYAS